METISSETPRRRQLAGAAGDAASSDDEARWGAHPVPSRDGARRGAGRRPDLSRAAAGALVRGLPFALAAGFILVCVLVVQWPMLRRGLGPTSRDMLVYFYPLNGLTGRMLRAGELPVWNPHQMSGMPLMGDPQAGWGSLITMGSYALLPLGEAIAATLTLHILVAALGMLSFMRSTGVRYPGAVLAALAYALPTQTVSIYLDVAYGNLAYVGALTWLPWLLLGADLARRRRGAARLAGWTVAAFAASQAVSSWLGQGAYYAFVATAAYVAFGALLGETARGKPLRARVRDLALHGGALTALSILLSAWTLFPRIEFLLASNLRSGYGEAQQNVVGGAAPEILWRYLDPASAYAGAAVILLVLLAPVLRPTRTQWFFLGMGVLTYAASLAWIVEAVAAGSPLGRLLGLVPGVTQLHLHFPQRISFLYVFFAAALAGSLVERLPQLGRRTRLAWLALALAIPLALWGALGGESRAVLALGFGACALTAGLTWHSRFHPRAACVALVGVTVVEIVWATSLARGARVNYALDRPESFYFHPRARASARLLESLPGPARYLGYDREIMVERVERAYRDPRARRPSLALLATSEASVYGLEDVQGYNPLHLASYDALLAAANGRRQPYRGAYIYPQAVDSPVLDMLNAAYIVTAPGARPGAGFPLVKRGERAWVYRNPGALPRAWIVHEARVADDETALRLIADGLADPRRVALTPRAVEGLAPPAGRESVRIERLADDEIVVRARLSAPGLLVLSELDYPAWKVEVNGESRPAVRVNGALRGVALPAGEHTVRWHYSSAPTNAGFALSGLAVAGLAVAFVVMVRPRRKRPQAPDATEV